ncbi:MAG: hypothetical protein K2X74_23320 [Acetobacteraceae bacterium]|nr:hypothetical protein [Acetobacteraceae bacterium]
MFILQQHPTWSWPVVVPVPQPDGGYAEQRFQAQFRLIETPRREELAKTQEGTDQLLRESILSTEGLVDEAGAPIPHSPELVEALLRNPWIRLGLVRSYVQAIEGVPIAPAAVGN